MAKLNRLTLRLSPPKGRALSTPNTSERRMSGGALQKRRYRLWLANPCCARCGRVVAYPHGFELDHVVALVSGGYDTEDKCQILCHDCHAQKTRLDLQP